MRTIYTTGGCVDGLFRIDVSDEQEQKTLKSRQFLQENGLSTIRFPLNEYNDDEHYAFEIAIERRNEQLSEDNIIRKTALATIGHECYEGWEPAITATDLLDLPKVHFEERFLIQFLNIDFWKPWEVVDLEHRQFLIPRLHEATVEALQRHSGEGGRYYEQNTPNWKTVADYCREIEDGTKNFDDFAQYLDGKHMQHENELNRRALMEGGSSHERG